MEPPGLGAGVDDVCAVGKPVDDGFGHASVGEHLGPFAEWQVRGHDQRSAFVAARRGPGTRARRLRRARSGSPARRGRPARSGRSEPTTRASSLRLSASWSSFASAARVVNRTRRPCWQAQTANAMREMCLAGARVADQDDRVAVIDPGALGQRGDRGLRDLRVIGEPEVLEPFDRREPGVDQPAFLASLGAFGHLGLEQRREIGDRSLLLADRFLGQARNRRRTVGSLSSTACASISASSAAVRRSWSRSSCTADQLVIAGQVGFGPIVRLQPGFEPVKPGCRRRAGGPSGEHSDRAAVDRAGRQRATDGELDAWRGRARGRASARRPSAGRPLTRPSSPRSGVHSSSNVLGQRPRSRSWASGSERASAPGLRASSSR